MYIRSIRLRAVNGLLVVGVAMLLLAASTPTSASPFGGISPEGPVLVTSSGQSPDAMIVKLLVDGLGLPGTALDGEARAEAVDGFQTLIIAIGGSMKGLGAAGIDTQQELRRVDDLIERAKGQGKLVVSIHIGGQARRGSLADPFIHGAVPKSDVVIVLSEGNQDQLFDELTPTGVPLVQVDALAELTSLLQQLFAK